MTERWLRWGSLLAVCAVFTMVAWACGGGGDDDDDDDELDLAALVVGTFEEEPSRLPHSLKLDSIQFNSTWGNAAVATADFLMSASDGHEAYGYAVIFRDERTARETLKEEVEGWEAVESEKSRGHFCFWDEFSYYTDPDFEGISYCLGRAGNVYIELEYGEVPDEDSEAGLDILLALERHFDGLIEDATRRPRAVPDLAKTAMLASIAPPGPGDAEFAGGGLYTTSDAHATAGFIGKSSWAGDAASEEFAFFFSFETADDADGYLEDTFPRAAGKDGESECFTPADTAFRSCVRQVEDVVIVAQRKVGDVSAPAVDPRLQAWTEALAEHVTDIGEGKLPRAPRATLTPSGSRTPTPPAKTPTAAATATPTALPPLQFVNAGTWTLDLVVEKNTCAGGLPAVGSTITLEYEFSDLDEDGYIDSGEPFGVEQFLPERRYVGVFSAQLPYASWVGEAKNGQLSWYSTIKLGFEAADSVFVDYIETYPNCEIVAR